MTDVYVVMGFDDDGPVNIKGIYTDPAVAQGIADQERAKPGPFGGGAVVETWELDNHEGHRTKTVYVAINDAPHRHNQEWTVRDPRIEDAELSEPDESVTWRKIGHIGGEHDQVIVTAPTMERARELMQETMDGYTPGGSES